MNEEKERGVFWQRLAAAVGALLIAGCVGSMAWAAFTGDGAPPDITLAATGAVPQREGGWLVSIRATNHGGTTAAELQIRGELREGGQVLETTETTFAFVPAHSTREAGLFFSRDPASLELRLSPVGYQEP